MMICNHKPHHSNDKDPPHPAPVNSQPPSPPPVNHHCCEQPPHSPFHDFDEYCPESLIYLTRRLLLHSTRLNYHSAICPCCDQVPHPPPPNPAGHNNDQLPGASASCMAEYNRLQPPPPQPIYYVYHGCCRHCPNMPPTIHPYNPQNPTTYIDNKPTFRVYTKAKTDLSLTIRDGKVVLAPTNPSDLHQHWIKDEKFGIHIKDERGQSSFALVNKATGEAMKMSSGNRLTPSIFK